MGFLNGLVKAVDIVDNAVTDARARHGANTEADRFAAKVQLHTTYYTIVRHRLPDGGEANLVHEHIATRRSGLTGQPMFGHMSASALWAGFGPVYTDRPRGLQTIRERSEANEKMTGPQIRGHISDY